VAWQSRMCIGLSGALRVVGVGVAAHMLKSKSKVIAPMGLLFYLTRYLHCMPAVAQADAGMHGQARTGRVLMRYGWPSLRSREVLNPGAILMTSWLPEGLRMPSTGMTCRLRGLQARLKNMDTGVTVVLSSPALSTVLLP
jgi:hypothetical protein